MLVLARLVLGWRVSRQGITVFSAWRAEEPWRTDAEVEWFDRRTGRAGDAGRGLHRPGNCTLERRAASRRHALIGYRHHTGPRPEACRRPGDHPAAASPVRAPGAGAVG